MRKTALRLRSGAVLVLMAVSLSACGFGSIKTKMPPRPTTAGAELSPPQGPAETCEAHFISLFKNYTEIGGNACNASMGVTGAEVDASMAAAVTSLAALAAKLSSGK